MGIQWKTTGGTERSRGATWEFCQLYLKQNASVARTNCQRPFNKIIITGILMKARRAKREFDGRYDWTWARYPGQESVMRGIVVFTEWWRDMASKEREHVSCYGPRARMVRRTRRDRLCSFRADRRFIPTDYKKTSKSNHCDSSTLNTCFNLGLGFGYISSSKISTLQK